MKNNGLSLETAKLLAINGWDKETLFSYFQSPTKNYHLVTDSEANDWKYYIDKIPCPSLEELLVVMPMGLTITKYADTYEVFILNSGLPILTETDPTEAVATLWIKLKKEKLIT